jgi:hypothetical protein
VHGATGQQNIVTTHQLLLYFVGFDNFIRQKNNKDVANGRISAINFATKQQDLRIT